MRRFALAGPCMLALLLSAPPIAADTEPNDHCGTGEPYSPSGTGFEYGTLSSTDTSDVFLFTADANQLVTIDMNPGYSPYTGKNYNLELRGPVTFSGCPLLESSSNSGITIERIVHAVPYDGTYAARVVWAGGSGGYDLQVSVEDQGTRQCSVSATAVVGGVSGPSCQLSSPECGSGSCWFEVRVLMAGVGVLAADFESASCLGVTVAVPCDSGWVSTYRFSFTDTCRAVIPAVAASATITCQVRLD